MLPGTQIGKGHSPNIQGRFTTLDALRGVAAIVVLNFHLGWFIGTWSPRFGYLAVDMFFLLSGFVLALTYEPKFRAGLKFQRFLALRAFRLGPLYLVGVALAIFVAPFTLAYKIFPSDILLATLLNPLGLPSPSHDRGAAIFILNSPLWSLFFEFWVANTAFVCFRKYLNSPILWIVILPSAIGLVIGEMRFYTLSLGNAWPHFQYGFPRIGFSFFLGVAIAHFRSRRPPQLFVPSWIFVLVLPLLLSLPLKDRLSHVYEVACVFFVFPVMIYFASSAQEGNLKLGKLLGDASYALYVLHWPLIMLADSVLRRLHGNPTLVWQLAFTICIVPVAWSFSVMDLRVRRALTKPDQVQVPAKYPTANAN